MPSPTSTSPPKDFDEAAVFPRKFAATRKVVGNPKLLDELGRSDRFAIVGACATSRLTPRHSAAVKTLGDELKPYVPAAFDTRPHTPLLAAAPGGDPKLGTTMYSPTSM